MILRLSLLIFLLPLLTFAFMAIFHKRLPRHGDFLATGIMGACLLLSLYIFWLAWVSPTPLFVNVAFDWLPMFNGLSLSGGIMVDHLTAVMLVVVTLVSFLVHLFSVKYMEGDVRYGRYFCCLLLFTTSMLGLVLANSLIYLYMFWELVGLSSYLLIGHWFEKKSASDAAIKAFITTRLGDVGMFIGIMVCYSQVGSLQYSDLFAAVASGDLSGHWRTIAGLGLFFGAMGKSAQFPLHVWLPDAMEGPTPVSALIHAATMVAAGVYLTGRLLPLFDPATLLFIAYIGGFTALFAATIALVQDDIKKVLAYSTVSQLGYMIMALGVGGYVSGLFHLTTHAFFKAGLFLGAGAVIYAMHHEQSMSKYGGLRKKMPITAACYLLMCLAIAGFPYFSAFWSKDAILADVLGFYRLNPAHWFLPFAGFATALLTAFYMMRLYFLTFTGKPRDHHAYGHAKEVPWQMLAPLILLGALAVVGGGFGHWFMEMNPKRSGIEQVTTFVEEGYTSEWTDKVVPFVEITKEGQSVAEKARAEHAAVAEHELDPLTEAQHKAHTPAMLIATFLGFIGIAFSALMYMQNKAGRTILNADAFARKLAPIYVLLQRKYYFDEIYDAVFVRPTRTLGWLAALFDKYVIDLIVNIVGYAGGVWAFVVEVIDRIIVDGIFVNGSAKATNFVGDQLSYTETGKVRQYLVMMVAGILIISGLSIWLFMLA